MTLHRGIQPAPGDPACVGLTLLPSWNFLLVLPVAGKCGSLLIQFASSVSVGKSAEDRRGKHRPEEANEKYSSWFL